MSSWQIGYGDCEKDVENNSKVLYVNNQKDGYIRFCWLAFLWVQANLGLDSWGGLYHLGNLHFVGLHNYPIYKQYAQNNLLNNVYMKLNLLKWIHKYFIFFFSINFILIELNM